MTIGTSIIVILDFTVDVTESLKTYNFVKIYKLVYCEINTICYKLGYLPEASGLLPHSYSLSGALQDFLALYSTLLAGKQSVVRGLTSQLSLWGAKS